MGIGRPPSAINEDQRRVICEALEQGSTLRNAAGLAGVTFDAVKEWRRKGLEGMGEPYATFASLTYLAQHKAEKKCVDIIIAAMPKDAKLAQWWLERRRWEDWYLSKVVTPEAAEGAIVPRLEELPLAELEAAVKQAADLKRNGGQ